MKLFGDLILDIFFPEPTQKDYALQPGLTTDIRPKNAPDEHAARTAHKYVGLDPITEEPEHCVSCQQQIKTMSFKGTGVCGTLCEKAMLGTGGPLVP